MKAIWLLRFSRVAQPHSWTKAEVPPRPPGSAPPPSSLTPWMLSFPLGLQSQASPYFMSASVLGVRSRRSPSRCPVGGLCSPGARLPEAGPRWSLTPAVQRPDLSPHPAPSPKTRLHQNPKLGESRVSSTPKTPSHTLQKRLNSPPFQEPHPQKLDPRVRVPKCTTA